MMLACQKENSLIHTESKNMAIGKYEVSDPLVFATTDEARQAMRYDRSATKSYIESFVSYAETVMQEDEYENREYALQSESFGSILNANGEVLINGYYLRLIDNGYLITKPEYADKSLHISMVDKSLLKASQVDLGVNDPKKLYELTGYEDLFFYDSFNIVSNDITTKGMSGVQFLDGYDTNLTRSQMEHGFTFPQGSDQKVTFPGRDDIANDTKIHREDNVFVSNTGIKTKTMKKGALGIWTKFACNIEAAITDIVISESWNTKPNAAFGWYDINKTEYPGGRNVIIATKYVNGSYSGISNATVASDCANALTWAKSKGLSVDSIDGVRYIYSNDSDAITRLKNLGGDLVYEKKYVIDFDIAPIDGGRFTSKPGMINGLDFGPSRLCLLQNCVFYGYSEFDGVKRGSRASYNINNK